MISRSVLICLTISSAVRRFVSILGFFLSMVPELDGQHIDVLLCRINENEISPIPIILLAVIILRSGNFCRHRTIIYWRELLVDCLSHKVLTCPVRLASVVTVLSRCVAKCAKHGNSVIIFFIALKSCSSAPVQFQSNFCSVVVAFGRFF